MILVAGTAIAASCGSVLAAHKLSSARAQALKPDLSEDIKLLFPETTKWMPEFERYVKIRDESGIYPVSRGNRRFVRQFDDISAKIVTYSHHPNETNQKQVKKALAKFWRTVEGYYWPSYEWEWAEGQYYQALKLQKDGLSNEFLDITISMIDTTFTAQIRNTITNSSRYATDSLGLAYHNLVNTCLNNWEVV